jgi:peroxiredoxin
VAGEIDPGATVEGLGAHYPVLYADRNGRVARIFPKVRVPGHVEEVEAAIRDLDNRE